MTLLVGIDSLGSVADADAYFAGSFRAHTNWVEGTELEDKEIALTTETRIFERQRWVGTRTGARIATAVAVVAGGSGYAQGGLLAVPPVGSGVPALVEILTVTLGAVTSVRLLDTGAYATDPTAASAASNVTGSGVGCTLTLTMGDQQLAFPRSGLVTRDGVALDAYAVPQDVLYGLFEGAYELTQDVDLETAEGTGSKRKRLRAGSAEIEFFSPSAGTRFPSVVMEYIAPYLSASGGISAPLAFGTDGETQFGDLSPSGLSEGL